MADKISQLMNRVNQAATAMKKRFDVKEVYLFGSQVRGSGDEWSDVDVGVFLAEFKSTTLRDRIQAIVDVQRELGDDLEFHFSDLSNPATRESVSFATEVKRTGVKIW